MSTTREPDYQALMRDKQPDPKKRSGQAARSQRRMDHAKTKITIRLDADLVEDFKRLAGGGKGYQSLINQALREWLVKQDVKELLREELGQLVGEAFESLKKEQPTNPS